VVYYTLYISVTLPGINGRLDMQELGLVLRHLLHWCRMYRLVQLEMQPQDSVLAAQGV